MMICLSGCQRRRVFETPKAVPVREDGALELRLMSFNVRYENPGDRESRSWRKRVVGAVSMIRRERPDVIGIQEALHGQAADLWASLPDYEFFGVGRDDGKMAGEYAGIFYQRDRFEPDSTDCGTFWLSDTPEKEGSKSWGNEIPRVAAWLRLVDRATGRGFYVMNTHWDHRNQPSRERAALLIARRIDARKHAEEPVALVGDFNSMENNPGLIYLTGRSGPLAGSTQAWSHGLADTYQSLHAAEKNRRTLHFWSGRRDGLKVDHILVSKGARIASAEIVSQDKPEVSDHFPVTARVIFPSTRP
ncbi:endonuclease/exonuclease/phosphatase family protein [Luteolibacter yonseiensis]|uniref:Endonuclease/exonuclease/phosphatase family protein n=1 Tax=Luteolibacter yonseiensis TaxID=1144680 RepID=A0A934R6T2_9BACT|nr:endonuclease/exonuclease/phosphatase family protein [Luteolibacter yonseiensis]MBK1816480.1 endonuclease/exonuclease/phosphatase family protein [Luteolibacter yonseiensis]